jgi:hypothetical protein
VAAAPPVPATPAIPPLAESAALPAVNAGVVAFAKANVGVSVDPANGADCYDFAAAALRAAGAKPQWQLGTDGPIGNHYKWGDLVYQKSLIGGYGNLGSLADIKAGDVIQMEQFRQQSPDGSWASATHDTQVVGSVDAATGAVQTFRQNWNGQKFVTQGQLNVSDMTSGVFSVYRPLPA